MAAQGPNEGRSFGVRAMLADIELQRALRDKAYDAAENPQAAWLQSNELERHAQGAQDGLESLVLDALGSADAPTDDELQHASGFTPEYVHELKVRLGLVEGEEPPAPARRRWFRR
jgi:hypothetical protein